MSEENCHEQPDQARAIAAMSFAELAEILAFANRVQAWSWRGNRRKPRFGTFAQAAKGLGVSVSRIALAVEAHYWMFADDPTAPIADRCIVHDGD